jgi:hypothetical protein
MLLVAGVRWSFRDNGARRFAPHESPNAFQHGATEDAALGASSAARGLSMYFAKPS